MYFVKLLNKEKLYLPFDEEDLAVRMAKNGWEDANRLNYQLEDDGNVRDDKISWIIHSFCERTTLLQLNTLITIADDLQDYDFYRAKFYYDEIVNDGDPLSFANVMYQIDDSYVCTYEYSIDGEDAYERLGKEIAGRNYECGEGLPDWAKDYIDYYQLGRDYGSWHYFDDEFYISTDDCNIDECECDWDDFSDEWNEDLFNQRLTEELAKLSGTFKSDTDRLFEFLEVNA